MGHKAKGPKIPQGTWQPVAEAIVFTLGSFLFSPILSKIGMGLLFLQKQK